MAFALAERFSLSSYSLIAAACILLVIYCLKSFFMFIPLDLLYITAGLVFPTWLALLLTYAGHICEASIGYFFGSHLGQAKVKALTRKYKKVDQFFEGQTSGGGLACFLARLFPLPFDVVSIFFGSTDMEYWKYIVCTLLGRTFYIIPFILVGDALFNPLSRDFLVPVGICVVLAGGFFIGFRYYKKSR